MRVKPFLLHLSFVGIIFILFVVHESTRILSNQQAHYFSVVLILLALYTAWRRGGWFGPPFLISVIIAYPLLTPFISVNLLDYRYFSGYAGFVQEVEFFAPAVFFGAGLLLYIAFAIKPDRFVPNPLKNRVNLDADSLMALLLGSVFLAVVFAYVGDAGEGTIVTQSYLDIVAGRNRSLAFSGGAWAVFMVVSYYFIAYGEARYKDVKILHLIFYSGFAFAAVYFLLHGRRVELAGYAVFLLLIWSGKRIQIRNFVLVVIGILLLDYVGSVRLGDNPLAMYTHSPDFNALPGGAGNITVGYVAAYWLVERGGFELLWGQTYLDQLIRIPPAFLNFDRPPLAYDYVNENFRLIGGEYFLLEPLINFGVPGLAVFAVIFVAVTNWSIRLLRPTTGIRAITTLLFAGTYIAMSYRTLWYGISPLVKPLIIALLVGGILDLLLKKRNAP